ncbi:tetratricopeptide repeat-containing serine/threonine-protein kinase [Streptomyces sulphureus]|uniref:serine/threonine-protein kinase n=1 Tax=Streptomyces sulphureus TaxID=47758 RepID=UPI000379F6BD|nr:tetratricopeptide repeat-containing serine/threonine-protein kinase [Streptomyces sulphureus]
MGESALIQGRYRLLDLIGRGGMGEVWRARDESLGRHVAVKCLKPLSAPGEGSDGGPFMPVLRERFRREARVAAGLQHRGVTVVHDFGEHQGLLYLVMELLDGANLGRLLADSGAALPVDEVLRVAEQVAEALAYTHEQGVVHRDLKPANVVRTSDGTVKICDFGIARIGHEIGLTGKLTGSRMAMGTPHYMSPEQIAGHPVDRRSDLYSFGCVLYEVATGRPPFDYEDAWSVLVGHRDTAPRAPREVRPELPEPLAEAILALLAKDPAHRPSDAAHLAAPLARARTRGAPQPPPAWSHGIGAGSPAGRGADRQATPPHVAALTGRWTGLTGPFEPTPAPQPPPADDPATPMLLRSRHSAAVRLGREGRWPEALQAHRDVAAARGQALGPSHPETLGSRYETAFALNRLGRHPEALREYELVAAARTAQLGAGHPDTLAAQQEAAYVLGRLGRHEAAHQIYAQVLAVRRATAGEDHPDTLRCRHNLAFTLGRLDRREEAYREAAAVAEARAEVLGPTHPDTLTSRYEVGYALGRLGRWEEALGVYRALTAARARVLGPEHPDTLDARYETGISLGRLGRAEEALDLFRALAEARGRTQGPEDPETLRARHGYGVNLGRLGRWDEALGEARDVGAVRERVLGPEHPDALASRREVAVGLGWLGRWQEALEVYEQVAAARQRTLGAAHPETLTSRSDLAHCLAQLGRTAEAAEALRRSTGSAAYGAAR